MAHGKQTLYQAIVDHLLEQIRNGELAPGDRIPSQNQLAARFGVSAITSRRALAELEAMGVVNCVQGKGSFVAGPPKNTAQQGSIGYLIQYRFSSDWQLYNPILAAVMRSVAESAAAAGYTLAFHTAERDERFTGWRQHDAWILAGQIARGTAESLVESGARALTLNKYFPDLGVPFVSFDNLAGGAMAASHLIELGHRRLAVVAQREQTDGQFAQRCAGFEMAMRQYGLEPEPRWLLDAGNNEGATCEAVGEILREAPPTAVFAVTDAMALGVLRAATQKGLHVPADISVIGYDDQPFARYCTPPLSTVRQEGGELGRRAFELIRRMLEGYEPSEFRIEIPPVLVARTSTGAPKGVEALLRS